MSNQTGSPWGEMRCSVCGELAGAYPKRIAIGGGVKRWVCSGCAAGSKVEPAAQPEPGQLDLFRQEEVRKQGAWPGRRGRGNR